MFFSSKQIQEILSLVDFRFADLVWKIFGPSHLSKQDKDVLHKFGIDINKLSNLIPPYWQNWMFGLLSGVLSETQTKQINYKDLLKYLQERQFKTPSKQEIEAYELACNRSYGYLKGLGDKMKKDITSYITDAELEMRLKQEKAIKEKISEGVLKRSTAKQIASKIASELDDWNRDWGRIVETEFQSVFNMGRMQAFLRNERSSGKVYFSVFPGACQSCIKLYLTAGVGSEPKIFRVEDLLANGSNIGRKRSDWKPTISPIHPFCRCLVMNYIDGDVWDRESQSFKPDPNYKRKIAPQAKVKVVVGDKTFYV